MPRYVTGSYASSADEEDEKNVRTGSLEQVEEDNGDE